MEIYKILCADLFRYTGEISFSALLKTYVYHLEFRYLFWMRVVAWTRKTSALRIFHYGFRYILYRQRIKSGIDIPYNTPIQPGFYIGHYGGIVVHPETQIGWNCNISNRVTIGIANRGVKKDVPEIGNCVYIGPGAVIIGNIKIGTVLLAGRTVL